MTAFVMPCEKPTHQNGAERVLTKPSLSSLGAKPDHNRCQAGIAGCWITQTATGKSSPMLANGDSPTAIEHITGISKSAIRHMPASQRLATGYTPPGDR
jgi:hypothetical protein